MNINSKWYSFLEYERWNSENIVWNYENVKKQFSNSSIKSNLATTWLEKLCIGTNCCKITFCHSKSTQDT